MNRPLLIAACAALPALWLTTRDFGSASVVLLAKPQTAHDDSPVASPDRRIPPSLSFATGESAVSLIRSAVESPKPISNYTTAATKPASGAAAERVQLRLSRADAVLAARGCANEDSRPLRPLNDGGTAGEPTRDCLAILQTGADVAAWTGWSHARTLRALLPRVSGKRAATTRRQLVSASLPAIGDAQPAAWLPAVDGAWSVYAANWARLRARVGELIHGGFAPPYPGERVLAWGNEGDDSIAIGRGLARVDRGETRNHVWAAAIVSARDARGAR